MTRPASDAKDRILKAARALFARKGFDGARVDEIAETAGVNKALIYYYFDGKRAILDDLISGFVRQSTQALIGFAQASGPIGDPQAEAHMRQYYRLFEENRDLLKIMLIESVKEEGVDTPIFRLIDLQPDTPVDEERMVESLKARGFVLDADREQRLVTEFFTGIVPEVCFLIFREKWSRHFGVPESKLNELFRCAIEETHDTHHREE
jgi:TetR/AcrR family transcriptional regulator